MTPKYVTSSKTPTESLSETTRPKQLSEIDSEYLDVGQEVNAETRTPPVYVFVFPDLYPTYD